MDIKSILPSTELVSFQARPSCPKCGVTEGELVNPNNHANMYAVDPTYCPGNQPATIKHEQVAMLTGTRTEHEHAIPCAGVLDEHLHQQCKNCHYTWLMRVKS